LLKFALEKGGKPPSPYAMSSSFLCGSCFKVSQSASLCTWPGAEKTLEGLLPGKNRRRAAAGPDGEFRRCHSLYHMKITVNLADLTSEQVQCLSQLGQFRDDQT
jgi:hypothetical protein